MTNSALVIIFGRRGTLSLLLLSLGILFLYLWCSTFWTLSHVCLVLSWRMTLLRRVDVLLSFVFGNHSLKQDLKSLSVLSVKTSVDYWIALTVKIRK